MVDYPAASYEYDRTVKKKNQTSNVILNTQRMKHFSPLSFAVKLLIYLIQNPVGPGKILNFSAFESFYFSFLFSFHLNYNDYLFILFQFYSSDQFQEHLPQEKIDRVSKEKLYRKGETWIFSSFYKFNRPF